MGYDFVRSLARASRQRLLIVVASTLAFFIVGLVLVLSQQNVYQADATLYVDVRGNDAALQQSDGLLANYYRNLPTSPRVLARAIDILGLQGVKPATLLGNVTAESLKGTNIVHIHAKASGDTKAADLANAVASAAVVQNRLDAAERSQRTRQYLTDELARLSDAISKLPPPPLGTQDPVRDTQLAILQSEYAVTYGHLQDLALEQSRSIDTLTILEGAQIPGAPIDASPRLYLAGAAVGGLIVGALLALFIERLDRRLRTADELARAIGSPFAVAYVPPGPRSGPDPFGLALAYTLASTPGRALMVAATSADGGAVETAARLAEAGVEAGHTVSVVTGDSSADMRSRWKQAERLDLTFLVVPPPQANATGLAMARDVDAAILVAVARRTRLADAERAAQILGEAGVKIAGGILLHQNWGKELGAKQKPPVLGRENNQATGTQSG